MKELETSLMNSKLRFFICSFASLVQQNSRIISRFKIGARNISLFTICPLNYINLTYLYKYNYTYGWELDNIIKRTEVRDEIIKYTYSVFHSSLEKFIEVLNKAFEDEYGTETVEISRDDNYDSLIFRVAVIGDVNNSNIIKFMRKNSETQKI